MMVELPADSDPNDFKRQIDEQVKAIRSNVGYQKSQLDQFNAQLPARAQAAVTKRRTRLGKAADVLKVLNIPLAPKPGAPDVSQLPIRRKIVAPLAPASAGEKSYQIDEAIYEHILGVNRRGRGQGPTLAQFGAATSRPRSGSSHRSVRGSAAAARS